MKSIVTRGTGLKTSFVGKRWSLALLFCQSTVLTCIFYLSKQGYLKSLTKDKPSWDYQVMKQRHLFNFDELRSPSINSDKHNSNLIAF